MVLGWFASNVSEALIGALLVRRFSSAAADLRTVRSVLVFCVAAVTAALLTSFLDAGLVRLIGWGNADFWTLWQVAPLHQHRRHAHLRSRDRDLRDVGADLGPPSANRGRAGSRPRCCWPACWRWAAVVFGAGVDDPGSPPSLLYLPLPFLVWAALRFGPPLTSLSFAIVAFLVIWGAGHGHGPFLERDRRTTARCRSSCS